MSLAALTIDTGIRWFANRADPAAGVGTGRIGKSGLMPGGCSRCGFESLLRVVDVAGAGSVPPAMSRSLFGDRTRLILLSFLMLFVELALIRWTGSNVIYLSYFSNFVLLGSFLGIGLGFLRGDRRPDLWPFAPVALGALVAFVRFFPVEINSGGGEFIYFGELRTSGPPRQLVLAVVFIVVAAVMACIAQGVARDVREVPAARGLQARPHRQRARDRRLLGARVPPGAAARLGRRRRRRHARARSADV